jgi:branched-chain amino acid transport system permease protein
MVLSIAIFALCAQLPNLLSGITTSMGEISLPIPSWSGDTYNLPFYYTSLVLLCIALSASWYIRHSKYGLILLAIRDDEERAQGLGVKVRPYKLGAYVISAIIVGMAGAMNAYFLGFISPTSAFDRSTNIATPLMAFLGGIGTLSGPLLGALIEVPLQQYITMQFGEQGWDLILYGVLFLVIILVLPDGIIPTLTRRRLLRKFIRSEKDTLEILSTTSNDISIALWQLSSSSVPQETSVQIVSNDIQQPYRVPSPIPHHRSAQITLKN